MPRLLKLEYVRRVGDDEIWWDAETASYVRVVETSNLNDDQGIPSQRALWHWGDSVKKVAASEEPVAA